MFTDVGVVANVVMCFNVNLLCCCEHKSQLKTGVETSTLINWFLIFLLDISVIVYLQDSCCTK